MLSRSAIRSYSVTVRDAPGNISSVSVVINGGSKAGKSGQAHLLSKFSFLNNELKSGLRFTRESELLGGIVSSKVTRDSIILNTQFLREDLPYFVESLNNVLTKTSFRPHELSEIVLPSALNDFTQASKSNAFKGEEALHKISFKKGYGNSLYYDGSRSFSSEDIKEFSKTVYTSNNVEFFASGVIEEDFKSFLSDLSLPTTSVESVPVKTYIGKESRIQSNGPSYAAIGLPIKPTDFAKFDILSATIGSSLLPSSSPLSKIGATSRVLKYKDAGLFIVESSGDAAQVSESIKKAKSLISSVSSSDLKSSVKSANLLQALQSSFESPLSYSIDESAANVKVTDFNYVAVGDIDVLPFADDL